MTVIEAMKLYSETGVLISESKIEPKFQYKKENPTPEEVFNAAVRYVVGKHSLILKNEIALAHGAVKAVGLRYYDYFQATGGTFELHELKMQLWESMISEYLTLRKAAIFQTTTEEYCALKDKFKAEQHDLTAKIVAYKLNHGERNGDFITVVPCFNGKEWLMALRDST